MAPSFSSLTQSSANFLVALPQLSSRQGLAPSAFWILCTGSTPCFSASSLSELEPCLGGHLHCVCLCGLFQCGKVKILLQASGAVSFCLGSALAISRSPSLGRRRMIAFAGTSLLHRHQSKENICHLDWSLHLQLKAQAA